MTNASWRLVNWLSEYAELMLMLKSEAGKVYCAMAQMYELYLLHVFYTFSSLNLADVIMPQQQQQASIHQALRLTLFWTKFMYLWQPVTLFCTDLCEAV